MDLFELKSALDEQQFRLGIANDREAICSENFSIAVKTNAENRNAEKASLALAKGVVLGIKRMGMTLATVDTHNFRVEQQMLEFINTLHSLMSPNDDSMSIEDKMTVILDTAKSFNGEAYS